MALNAWFLTEKQPGVKRFPLDGNLVHYRLHLIYDCAFHFQDCSVAIYILANNANLFWEKEKTKNKNKKQKEKQRKENIW